MVGIPAVHRFFAESKKNEKNQKGKTGNEISSFFPSSFVRQRSSTLLQCHNLMVHRPRAYCDSAAEFPEIIDDRIQTLLIVMKMRNVSSAAGKSKTLLDIDIDEAGFGPLCLCPVRAFYVKFLPGSRSVELVKAVYVSM